MVAYYKVTISYPDGHLEEIEEEFMSMDKAVDFGEKYIAQVYGTESFKGNAIDEGNLFGRKVPFFYVDCISDEGSENVYNSSEK